MKAIKYVLAGALVLSTQIRIGRSARAQHSPPR